MEEPLEPIGLIQASRAFSDISNCVCTSKAEHECSEALNPTEVVLGNGYVIIHLLLR